MNKTRFLIMGIVLLALLNIVSLFFHWKPPGHHRFDGPEKIIIDRLHFDQRQVSAYQLLIEKHRAGIRQKDEEIATARQAIYSLLQSNDFSKKDSLIAEIGRLQMAVEEIHLDHFQEIKKLCRAEQLPYFKDMISELHQLFGKPKSPAKR